MNQFVWVLEVRRVGNELQSTLKVKDAEYRKNASGQWVINKPPAEQAVVDKANLALLLRNVSRETLPPNP